MTAPVRTAACRAAACVVALLAATGALPVTSAAAEEPVRPTTAADTATVGIVVNTPPHAGSDSVTTVRDLAVTVDLLANDVDPDGDPLVLAGGTSVGHGTLVFVGSLVTYTPDGGWSGVDEFTYLVDDGRGGQDTGQVRVTVVAPGIAGPHLHPVFEHPPVVAQTVPTAPRPPVVRLPAPVRPPVALASAPRSGTTGAAAMRALRRGVPAAGPALLPVSGSRTGGLAGLGAGLVAVGFLLVLLGRLRRPA